MFEKPILSIDIGSENIKVVLGKCVKNKVYINKMFNVETPPRTVEDGNLVGIERLGDYLKNSLDYNGIRKTDVIFTTSNTSVIYREIFVPNTEEGDFDTMVNFELQQYLPIVMENYVIQYRKIGVVKHEETSDEKIKVMAVAYPKFIIQGYLKLVDIMELKAKALDINFNVINKLLVNNNIVNGNLIEPQNTIAFIDMGAENININILSNGKMDFSRIVVSGGMEIDRHIAAQYGIEMEKAEKIKIKHCDLIGENSEDKYDDINNIIKADINSWIEDIDKILIYYKNKNVGNKIDYIYLYGGSSRLKGIDEYISKRVNTPVAKINFMNNLQFNKNLNEEEIDFYLNAIGALIRL